ncbi:MAG: hypothetical protein AAF799_25800 [Myxococcota bacterium]
MTIASPLRSGVVLLAALSFGCGDDGSTASGSPAATDTGQATTSDSEDTGSPTPTSAASTSGADDSTGSEPPSATTGGPELCGVEDSETPFFVLRHGGSDLPPADATLRLVCGGQGSFMIDFRVDVGGVNPAGEEVNFGLTLDVEGFNVGPGGHFFDNPAYPVYVGCEENDGGLSVNNRIIVFPPDEIADLTVLDGATMTLNARMTADDGSQIEFDATGIVSSVQDDSWGCCLDKECL